MNRKLVFALALVLAFAVATPHADARSDAKAQVEFGIEVALRGLWQEAMYRWQRAIELDPTYVQLAVNRWEAYTGQVATRHEALRT